MVPISPFASGRWEYEHQTHFYYLGSREYQRVASAQKHVFLIGHRGTGKTTLLKALDWGERQTNENLLRWFERGPYADGNIGCFVGLKTLDLQVFDDWLADSRATTSHQILGAYFRAVWVHEAVTAVRRVSRSLGRPSLRDEILALAPISDVLQDWIPSELGVRSFDARVPLTLESLDDAATALRRYLHGEAVLDLRRPEQIVAAFGLTDLLTIVNDVFRCLSNLMAVIEPRIVWRFRICMDEGEYLSDLARQSVRTFVRECESPLLLVVAALSDLGSETVFPGVVVTLDDREVVDLDSRSIEEFRDLINGIVKARWAALDLPPVRFDIRELLGNPTLDTLLLEHPSETMSLKAVKRGWSDWRSDPSQSRERGPIRTFLERTGLVDALDAEDADRARQLDSSGFRKYHVVGYLRLLGASGVRKPFYAGWRPFTYCADNSVRDLLLGLETLKDLWWRRGRGRSRGGAPPTVRDYADFASTKGVQHRLQDSALNSLGAQKLAAFNQRILHDTDQARKLLAFTAQASHTLDFGNDPAVSRPRLDSAKFVVRIPGPEILEKRTIRGVLLEDQARFVSMIRECAEEGYLKGIRVNRDTGEVQFRLHHSLARYYGCSYRTAQYSTRIPWSAVEAILSASATSSVRSIVRSALAYRRLLEDDPQQRRLI